MRNVTVWRPTATYLKVQQVEGDTAWELANPRSLGKRR